MVKASGLNTWQIFDNTQKANAALRDNRAIYTNIRGVLFQDLKLSTRAALLCTWNRDLEKYAMAFHFSHVMGPDREVTMRDAFQKCSNNIHN